MHMPLSSEEYSNSLLRDLNISRESGMRDSSMINMLEAVFCNIPDYLSNPIEDNYLNFNGEYIDTSVVYEQAEKIIDSILEGPIPDFDALVDTTGGDKSYGYVSVKKSSSRNDDSLKSLENPVKRSAIIEFGCETDQCEAVEYDLVVKPGESINENTVIGHVK